MIGETHLIFEGGKYIFLVLYFYWELVLGTMFFGCVCSSLFKSILLGTYCYWELVLGFFCVAISLRAFSCQLASVVDFCGVVYLSISLFRNILCFFSGENTFTVFWGVSLGKFGFIEYMDGVVWFFLYTPVKLNVAPEDKKPRY